MKNLFYAFLALAVVSCGGSDSKPKGLLAENDFESMDGWAKDCVSASLNKEKAHSGIYSVKVNPGTDFSMGYNNQVGKLSSTRLQKIKVHAWVNVPNDKAVAALVVEVKDPSQNNKGIFWDGMNMVEAGKEKGFNKWIEVEKTYDLPEAVNYNSQLLVYMWRGSSSQPVYMDDVQLIKAD